MRKRFTTIAVLTGAALLGGTTLLYAQGALRSSWSGVYTTTQAGQGKTLFEENCAKCHGGTLDGNDEIPALKGSHFLADWESQTVADLIDRVHTTMPMDDPGKLSTPSATLVVTYLLQQNQIPGGSAELTDLTALHVRIDSTKPGS